MIMIILSILISGTTRPRSSPSLDLNRQILVQTVQLLNVLLWNPTDRARAVARRGCRFVTPVQLLHTRSQSRG